MSEFFKLHQRQDIVLYTQGEENFIGVILGYNEDSYAIRPLDSPKGTASHDIIGVGEDEVLQKVGSLDFDSLYEAEAGFEFGDWVEVEDF